MNRKGGFKCNDNNEIQAVPEAIPALRYFYEDMPELPVVSAGSLLEFTLRKHTFSMLIGMKAICGLDWRSISQMDEIKLINQGAIAEQFIGQHLQAMLADKPNRELHYWLREGRSSNAEVDFVIAPGGESALKIHFPTCIFRQLKVIYST